MNCKKCECCLGEISGGVGKTMGNTLNRWFPCPAHSGLTTLRLRLS